MNSLVNYNVILIIKNKTTTITHDIKSVSLAFEWCLKSNFCFVLQWVLSNFHRIKDGIIGNNINNPPLPPPWNTPELPSGLGPEAYMFSLSLLNPWEETEMYLSKIIIFYSGKVMSLLLLKELELN